MIEAIVVFISNVLFMFLRTWNINSIAKRNIKMVLISGGLIHITWLFSTALAVGSAHAFFETGELKYLPIVLTSLTGSLLGTYLGIMKGRSK
jgi:hypothetical protein